MITYGNNPIIFYHQNICNLFIKNGLNPKKAFVANNTFYVNNRTSFHMNKTKDLFLHVGTLDYRKENHVLIRVFQKIVTIYPSIYLYVVGNGSELNNLKKLVKLLKLEKNVYLLGRIEDTNILKDYYSRAISSISWGQAGLTVLQSMAFGVPFITKKNSISGGEKYNIINNYNGFLLDDDILDLEKKIIHLIENPKIAQKMGLQAFNYYNQEASLNKMLNGFKLALDYNFLND